MSYKTQRKPRSKKEIPDPESMPLPAPANVDANTPTDVLKKIITNSTRKINNLNELLQPENVSLKINNLILDNRVFDRSISIGNKSVTISKDAVTNEIMRLQKLIGRVRKKISVFEDDITRSVMMLKRRGVNVEDDLPGSSELQLFKTIMGMGHKHKK